VPFTLVYARKYRTEDRSKIDKTKHNPEKQTMQNTAKQNYPGSVAFYDTRPGNEVGLFCNAVDTCFYSELWLLQCWCTIKTTTQSVSFWAHCRVSSAGQHKQHLVHGQTRPSPADNLPHMNVCLRVAKNMQIDHTKAKSERLCYAAIVTKNINQKHTTCSRV